MSTKYIKDFSEQIIESLADYAHSTLRGIYERTRKTNSIC